MPYVDIRYGVMANIIAFHELLQRVQTAIARGSIPRIGVFLLHPRIFLIFFWIFLRRKERAKEERGTAGGGFERRDAELPSTLVHSDGSPTHNHKELLLLHIANMRQFDKFFILRTYYGPTKPCVQAASSFRPCTKKEQA
jgi:hypothetical protein